MLHLVLFDVAPDPVSGGAGALVTVLLLVIGSLMLLAAALVVFLWYRKRSFRGVEMIRPDVESIVQPSNPNQP
ncbi:MAG: hypothetical protein QOK48_1983 [Blastocatellia bacterium]|jgi:hypothetical protein|nr:hypothetical protein [Blastocatellia bacterium]